MSERIECAPWCVWVCAEIEVLTGRYLKRSTVPPSRCATKPGTYVSGTTAASLDEKPDRFLATKRMMTDDALTISHSSNVSDRGLSLPTHVGDKQGCSRTSECAECPLQNAAEGTKKLALMI